MANLSSKTETIQPSAPLRNYNLSSTKTAGTLTSSKWNTTIRNISLQTPSNLMRTTQPYHPSQDMQSEQCTKELTSILSRDNSHIQKSPIQSPPKIQQKTSSKYPPTLKTFQAQEERLQSNTTNHKESKGYTIRWNISKNVEECMPNRSERNSETKSSVNTDARSYSTKQSKTLPR